MGGEHGPQSVRLENRLAELRRQTDSRQQLLLVPIGKAIPNSGANVAPPLTNGLGSTDPDRIRALELVGGGDALGQSDTVVVDEPIGGAWIELHRPHGCAGMQHLLRLAGPGDKPRLGGFAIDEALRHRRRRPVTMAPRALGRQ
ncbi:hypothetical protein [Agromyces bauzanensis]|uniref:hypothetical protein n=1 Tax=Agromyces bauzanensis TaxID=1308924 RepID=UPI001666EB9F|nr:hypothetical protein [Agromyces bauzanensis]